MRPLLLVGPPGSCRSKIAQLVAARIEGRVQTAGVDELGGLISRSMEERTVVDVASEAWLERATRVQALDAAVVVSVMGNGGRDGARTAEHAGTRGVDLWRHLTIPFRESHHIIRASIDALDAAVDEAIDAWRRDGIAVAAGEQSYVVDIGHDIFDARCQALVSGDAATLFVTDSNVDKLYGERVMELLSSRGTRAVRAVFAAGEENKHLGTLRAILEEAQRGGIDRGCRVLAFGGGVVTDVGGFAAATWMRGVRWISVPTTLLGMVDASVGGKTAVDLGEGKNAVGAFWQPTGVICDVQWLRTESERNYSSALAEVVKTAIIGDPELFVLLEESRSGVLARDVSLLSDVVRRCIRVKARIVGLDERERGLRASLNLGHTLGHALEAAGGLGSRTHGEAVSLGLVAACRLGVRLGMTPLMLEQRVTNVLRSFGLPTQLNELELQGASDLVGLDKKRKGKDVKFVFACALGKVTIEALALKDLRNALPSLAG